MKENIKEEIINTSRDLFNAHGYHTVTMRMIASSCHISVGNLTYYYPKKKDILKDLLDSKKPTKQDQNMHSLEDLYRFIYEMIDGVRKNHFFFSSSDMQSLDSDSFEENKKNVHKIHTEFIHCLEQLQNKKIISTSMKKEEMETYVSTLMLAHLSWANEEKKNSSYTSLTFEEFMMSHFILLKPYLTHKGLKELDTLKDYHYETQN